MPNFTAFNSIRNQSPRLLAIEFWRNFLKSAVTVSRRAKCLIDLRRKFCGLTSAFPIRCTPRFFTQDLWHEIDGWLLAGSNHRHIDKIAICAIEPPCLFRIVDNIKIQPLADDGAFYNVESSIAKVLRLAAGGAGSKITGFDLQNRRTNARCFGTFKNVNAFFFANVPVKGT